MRRSTSWHFVPEQSRVQILNRTWYEVAQSWLGNSCLETWKQLFRMSGTSKLELMISKMAIGQEDYFRDMMEVKRRIGINMFKEMMMSGIKINKLTEFGGIDSSAEAAFDIYVQRSVVNSVIENISMNGKEGEVGVLLTGTANAIKLKAYEVLKDDLAKQRF